MNRQRDSERESDGRAEDLFDEIVSKGEAALDYLVETRKSEELFLDFKRSADNGNARKLNDTDRNNLAKAISGFGNSEGGVIIWGVDCSSDKTTGADVARLKVPIVDVGRFVSWLEGSISGCTVPPHRGVRSHAIPVDQGNGFVVTYIPKSDAAPLQAVGKLQYFIRAGSDFVPTPHGVLAGMFGRRPQPKLIYQFVLGPEQLSPCAFVDLRADPVHTSDRTEEVIEAQIGFLLRNCGSGMVSDLFVNLWFSGPGSRSEVKFEIDDKVNWTARLSFLDHLSVISQPSFRLAPEDFVQPFLMHIRIAPPFTGGIRVEGYCGCGNAPPKKFKLENGMEAIQQLYTSAVGAPSFKDVRFTERLLNI